MLFSQFFQLGVLLFCDCKLLFTSLFVGGVLSTSLLKLLLQLRILPLMHATYTHSSRSRNSSSKKCSHSMTTTRQHEATRSLMVTSRDANGCRSLPVCAADKCPGVMQSAPASRQLHGSLVSCLPLTAGVRTPTACSCLASCDTSDAHNSTHLQLLHLASQLLKLLAQLLLLVGKVLHLLLHARGLSLQPFAAAGLLCRNLLLQLCHLLPLLAQVCLHCLQLLLERSVVVLQLVVDGHVDGLVLLREVRRLALKAVALLLDQLQLTFSKLELEL